MTIVIVDYGLGNVSSVQNAIREVGYSSTISDSPECIEAASIVVLPGQGAVLDAMDRLRQTGLDRVIISKIESGTPYLGICLGLQLLFDYSEENGGQNCLGVFKGTVRRFNHPNIKVPQMGWNELEVVRDSLQLTTGLPRPLFAYFAHSYYVDPSNSDIILTTTQYGESYVSAIQTQSVLGVQFHPEKSGPNGLAILKGFFDRYARQNSSYWGQGT